MCGTSDEQWLPRTPDVTAATGKQCSSGQERRLREITRQCYLIVAMVTVGGDDTASVDHSCTFICDLEVT